MNYKNNLHTDERRLGKAKSFFVEPCSDNLFNKSSSFFTFVSSSDSI